MLVLCWHNGALGHVTQALLECCTKEGNQELPSFISGKNLHHFKSRSNLFLSRHPLCDVFHEKQQGNTVLACTSRSDFGRFLILLMGLSKWNKQIPGFNMPSVYKQKGMSYGEQLEILSLTLRDKVYDDIDWYLDADQILDILDYWKHPENLITMILACGLTPIKDRVEHVCRLTANSNAMFYNSIVQCFNIVHAIMLGNTEDIKIDFWQAAVCHAKLLNELKISHQHTKLFLRHPTNTRDFIGNFYA